MIDGGKNLLFPGELDLQLGGMDVDIHRPGAEPQLQKAHGIASHGHFPLIGLLHRRRKQAGADIAPVDVKALLAPVGPGALRSGDIAPHGDVPHLTADGGEIARQLPSRAGIDGREHLPVPRGGKALPPILDEAEGHPRPGDGHLGEEGFGKGPLGGVFFQKFGPGGDVEKEIPHHDGGPHRAAGLSPAGLLPRLQGELDPLGPVRRPGEEIHPRHRSDGRQRFAPEAQGPDGGEIALGADLGGGVTEKGRPSILGQNAAAVVGDADIGDAPVLELHGDMLRPRVHGVFHQLLDHRARPLHHLARGDEVRQLG